MKTTIISSLITIVAGLLNIVSVSALTYQTKTPVQFTFNPTLSIDLSSSDIYISNLAPGTASDSNIVTISVNTNTTFGYVLSATAGIKGGNTNLVNTMDSSYQFTNLATTAGVASTLSNIPDNYWGYAYSTDSGSTWISGSVGSTATGYAGLPLDANDSEEVLGQGGTTLLSTDSASDSRSIQFKIGAKSSATQAAGSYTNTINFYAVSNPEPDRDISDAFYMQQVTTCPSTLPTGTAYTLTDIRDGEEYKVAKLADGKCWMVENLNLAGGTALGADDTQVDSSYISSFTTSNNLIKDGDTIVLPASSTSGFNTNNYSYVYNSGNKENCGASGQKTPCYSYYSWDAATLGSGRSISTDNTDAPYSICPKGWRLPTSRTTSATNWQTTSDFYVLAHQYGLDSTTSTSESDNGFYTQAGPGTTPNFLLAGRYDGGSFSYGGSYGFYWSATSSSGASYARDLYFDSGYIDSAGYNSRRSGFSVRCLLDV